MKSFKKLLFPALNRPRTATAISSWFSELLVVFNRPESAEIR